MARTQYNPSNPRSLNRLCATIRAHRRPWREFVDRYLLNVREILGMNYSSNGTPDRRPINLVHLERTILLQNLVVENPRVLVTTDDVRLLPAARMREMVANRRIKSSRLAESIRTALSHAYFLMGVIKTGVTSDGVVDIGGTNHEVGAPFADPVSPENFGFDFDAPSWNRIRFCYDRYVMDYDAVMESDLYDKRGRDALSPIEDGQRDDDGGETARSLSADPRSSEESFGRIVKPMDVWLPNEKLLITLPSDKVLSGGDAIPLRVQEWTGDPNGMYHRLSLDDAPDQLVPLAPVMQTLDMQHSTNVMLNKYLRQVIDLKTNPVFGGGAEKDMQRIVSAPDGVGIRVDNPDRIKMIQSGNPDPRLQAAVIYARGLWSYARGNPEAQGGLTDQADTLGESKMITGAASKMIDMYQHRVLDMVRGVCTDYCRYEEDNPLLDEPLSRALPGFPNIVIPMRATAADYAKTRGVYRFDVEPYSMRGQTPDIKMKAIMGIVQGIIQPMMPLMMNPQSPIDVLALVRRAARLQNVEAEIDEILRYVPPPEVPPPREDSEGMMRAPAQTNRTYTRVGKPGGSQQSRDSAMAMALMAGADSNQPSDNAAMVGM